MTSIPINTSSAACFIITKASDVNKMLLLKRAGEGYWCHVAGKIESNETAINAVIREVKEETGLVISELFSADYIIQFYDVGINTFFLVPAFVAFIPQDSSIQLNEEHVDYRWCSLEEAKHLTPFTNQHVAYDYIWELFCKAKPNDLLRINT